MNKIALVACFMALLSAPAVVQAQTIYPDVNSDGEVNIADVNGVISFILQGNTEVPSPNKEFLSAREYGAVGDGVTDDTEALEKLFDAAFRQKKAVFFDQGVYMIRRSLTLRSGMEIYGYKATLKKNAAVTTTLAAAAVKDQTFIDVASAEGFNVGDQFVIADSDGANWCTYGLVTAVEGNRIHFKNIISDMQSNFPGCVRQYPAGYKVSTSFALLRSWASRFACEGVYIHDLTLDGNKRSDEARSWANSCIHMDSYYENGYTGQSGIEYRNAQRNLIARNLVIMNSPHDGISDQSAGGLIVTDCRIENSAMHGVHLGTRFAGALISNNRMTGNGVAGAGVFFCQTVTNVIVDNNLFTFFNHGCSDEEFGTSVKYVTIRNNQFKNITGYVFDFLRATSAVHGGGLQISNNTVEGLKAALFSGDFLDDVIISNNEVKSVKIPPTNLINVVDSKNVIISGNTVPSTVSLEEPVKSTNTTNLVQSGNSWN